MTDQLLTHGGPGTQAEPDRPRWTADRVEDTVKLAILIAIMAASLAASFTHMRDWTLHWMPHGTPEWFGWANAVISELLPLVATLSLRKRLRLGKPLWSYALVVLLGGAVLSLAAQLSAVGSDASWSARFLACLPSLAFLLLSKLVMGDLDAATKHAIVAAETEAAARAEAEARAEALRAARSEVAAARRAEAEAEARAKAEADRAEAEAEARAEAEAEGKAEAEARALAEADRLNAAVRAAKTAHQKAVDDATAAYLALQDRVAEETAAARLAEGQLLEAQHAADRAATVRVLAEQAAQAEVQQLTTAAELAREAHEQELMQARVATQRAEDRSAELAEALRVAEAQLAEAHRLADRMAAAAASAEQEARARTQAHEAVQVELDRVRRSLARLQEQRSQEPEIARLGARPANRNRKSIDSAAAPLPVDLPEVDGVKPEKVAVVLAARQANPGAKQAELAALTGITDRTIRKVLNGVPPEIAKRVYAEAS